MRIINPAALAKILEREGTDPISLVQIFWIEEQGIIYGDRAFTPEIKGQLLDLGDIDNVINANEGSNTGSVSIRLNDTDGSLKAILDKMDIHKRPVYILQWFPEIPLKDAFIIFDGVISSPVVWKEGERTLSFEVVSKIEDLEIGFSAEEGNFEYIPENIVGRAWPVVFGSVLRIPAIRINDIPSGYNQEDTGIDGTTQNNLKNIGDNEKKNVSLLMELERECFTMAAILLGNADAIVVTTGKGDRFNRKSDDPLAQQLFELGTQYEAKGNEYLKERLTPINVGVFDNPSNKALEKNQLHIAGGNNFPQKQNIIITINGADHEGYFEGEVFTIVSRTHPFTDQADVIGPTEVVDRAVATEYKTTLAAETFFYAIAGSTVNVALTDYPVYYIVGIPWLTNITVLAKKTNGGINKYVVPASYYSVQHKTFGTLKATFVVMSRPLSSRKNENWEDDIWVNATSPVGPNGVDVLEWLIEHYTNQSIDPVSFAYVKPLVNTYKTNFIIGDRRNALEVIKEIAYQLRCAIWFKAGRFYIKYLAKEYPPVDTLTEDDVESGTMEVFSSETEDVVTKWEVLWKKRLDLDTPYKIVYRYHITKYGLVKEEYDCYCFNAKTAVQKFALFWLLRKANTWKKVRFSTFLTKLALEPFDSVLIDFTYPWVNDPACVTPTIGIVETASYNSDSQRIELTIWLPIRFGEMCPYAFAYPSDLDITYIFPQEHDDGVNTDIPGSDTATGSQLYDQTPHVGNSAHQETPPNFGSGGMSPGDSGDNPANFNPPTELEPGALVNTGRPTGTKTVSQRTIKSLEVTPIALPDAAYPGFVIEFSVEDNAYLVNIYMNGLANPPTIVRAKQLKIHESDKIDKDTPCIVFRNVQRTGPKNDLIAGVEYTMQVPIWLKAKKDEEEPPPPAVPNPDEGTNEPPVAEPEVPDPNNPDGDETIT